MESPVWTFRDHTRLLDLNNFFNWSMSYRLDSNFPVSYGSITKKAAVPEKNYLGETTNIKKIFTPFTLIERYIKQFGYLNKHLAFKEGRNSSTGLAVWFVSNCNNYSGRQKFAEKLNK